MLSTTGAHRREELLSATASTNSGMRRLFRGSLSEDRDAQAKARGEEHRAGWSAPRSSACLEDKTRERSWGAGQHSDAKAEVRCQKVCARVAGVPGWPPGKVHSYRAGGLCGRLGTPAGIDLVRAPLEKVHLAGKTAETD